MIPLTVFSIRTFDRDERASATRGSAYRRVGSALLMAAFAAAQNPATPASVVRVVDEAGRPVPDAMVACVRGGTEGSLSAADGMARVPDACTAVYCERGGLVPDGARVERGKASCLLRAGLDILVEMPESICRKVPARQAGYEGCGTHVHPPGEWGRAEALATPGPRRSDAGQLERPERPGSSKAGLLQRRLHPLLPGSYHLTVYRSGDRWSCSTELIDLPAGERTIVPVWREPAVLKGRVLDARGKPVADVPLFVRVEGTAAQDAGGGWVCGQEDTGGEPPASGPEGSFVLSVDPGIPLRVEAGWKNYPLGTASAPIHCRAGCEVSLRLE